MKARRAIFALSVLSLCVAPSVAHAQGDRGKRGAKPAAAVRDTGRTSARAAFASAMVTLTATPVSEGSFNAAISPWSSAGNAVLRDIGHFSGSASVSKSGVTYHVLLCANGASRQFTSSLTFSQRSGSQASVSPEFSLPDPSTVIMVSAKSETIGRNPGGSLKISLFGNSVSGIARLEFAQGHLPGTTTAEPVEVGISFRAPIVQNRPARTSCGSPVR